MSEGTVRSGSVKSAEKLGDLKGGEKIVNNLSMFGKNGRMILLMI